MMGAKTSSALVALVIGVAMVGAEREENTGCCAGSGVQADRACVHDSILV